MSGFSADWLALREPADACARSADLIARAGADLGTRVAPLVCDLGSGTGAGMRAFAPAFPRDTRWLLTDNDPDTLAVAARSGDRVETRLTDLAADPAPWSDDCALVTATALFDLAAPAWIDRLADRLAAARLPLLACLTYDGRVGFSPAQDGDAAICAAFNRHQRQSKGLGGAAAGPGAVDVLCTALAARGYAVHRADAPWRLTADRDSPLIADLLGGWAAAMVDAGLVDASVAGEWLAARMIRTDRVTVGHTDLYARPPAA